MHHLHRLEPQRQRRLHGDDQRGEYQEDDVREEEEPDGDGGVGDEHLQPLAEQQEADGHGERKGYGAEERVFAVGVGKQLTRGGTEDLPDAQLGTAVAHLQ